MKKINKVKLLAFRLSKQKNLNLFFLFLLLTYLLNIKTLQKSEANKNKISCKNIKIIMRKPLILYTSIKNEMLKANLNTSIKILIKN